MPRFAYTAKVQPKKAIQGYIDAESEQEAIDKLTRSGYFPISVQSEAVLLSRTKGLWRLRKVSHKDIAWFSRQLSTLVESGINILNGLNIVYNQTSNKYLKAILSQVIQQVKEGRSLSESLAPAADLFSPVYCPLIRAGEVSGNLSHTLKRLADFLEKEEEWRDSLRASLTYPLFVFIVGVLTVFVFLAFVMPRLVAIFEDMGQTLPLSTRLLMSTSYFLHRYWWAILATIFILIAALRRLFSLPSGRISWDRLKLRLVLFGPIILKTEISHLMRTLSLLLSSGLAITASLEIAAAVLGNRILKDEVRQIQEQITRGTSLSEALKNRQLFPELVVNIIAVGEETGTLEKALLRIAEDYEKDLDRSLKVFFRLLEPVVILALGLIVGFIVFSMLLPIFQINLMVR